MKPCLHLVPGASTARDASVVASLVRFSPRRLLRLVTLCATALLFAACSPSSAPTRPAALGTAISSDQLLGARSEDGIVRLRKVVAADWQVPLSGLLDLSHPRARAAGLVDGPEPIKVFSWVVDHPHFGRWLIDSGIAASIAERPTDEFSLPVRLAMDTAALDVHVTTASLLADPARPLRGVVLTHLHLDHIMGLPDLPEGVPVYAGPGETSHRSLQHAATRGTTDRLLRKVAALEELQFSPDPGGRFEGVLDLFGDGSVVALWVPGHTPGNLAFLIRARDGLHLLLGDASHTAWGWQQGVPPGSYSIDAARGMDSLQRLRDFARLLPDVRVHPGHQELVSQQP